MRLLVGISDALPKLIAYRLLQPALAMGQPIRLVCHEDKPDRLLAELSSHNLDMVLTDSPLTAATRVRAFNHLLGSCGVPVRVRSAGISLQEGVPEIPGSRAFPASARKRDPATVP